VYDRPDPDGSFFINMKNKKLVRLKPLGRRRSQFRDVQQEASEVEAFGKAEIAVSRCTSMD